MTSRESAARQLEDVHRALSAAARQLAPPDQFLLLGLVLTVSATVDVLRRLDAADA